MKWLRVGSLLLALSLLAACAAAPVATTAPPLATPEATAASGGAVTRTEVIDYEPAIPAETAQGSCFASSESVFRPGAYRCTIGNSIQDPCFTGPDGETIICGADPITDAPGVKLELTEPLPTPEALPAGATGPAAWLIRFADGVYCNYNTGATGGVGGERINYLCSDKSVGIGDIDTSSDVWQVTRGNVEQGSDGQFTSKDAAKQAIETAWR